jgi:ketosteroid isomerase-like protein
MKTIILSFIVTVSLVACTSPSPQFDLGNAKKEIEAANQELSTYISNGDSVGLSSAYSEDGALMLSNMPTIKGKDNLIKAWSGIINAGVTSMSLTTLEVWGDANYITEEGLIEIKAKDGAQLDKGKYIVLWKKENGKWKIHRDLSNSDLPLATN